MDDIETLKEKLQETEVRNEELEQQLRALKAEKEIVEQQNDQLLEKTALLEQELVDRPSRIPIPSPTKATPMGKLVEQAQALEERMKKIREDLVQPMLD